MIDQEIPVQIRAENRVIALLAEGGAVSVTVTQRTDNSVELLVTYRDGMVCVVSVRAVSG